MRATGGSRLKVNPAIERDCRLNPQIHLIVRPQERTFPVTWGQLPPQNGYHYFIRETSDCISALIERFYALADREVGSLCVLRPLKCQTNI